MTDYVSSHEVVSHLQIYERLPAPIQTVLQHTLWINVGVSLANVLVYGLVYPATTPFGLSMNTEGWLLLDPAVNFLAQTYHQIAPLCLGFSGLTLVISVGILLLSWGFSRPLAEPFHWLIGLLALPSGLTLVLAALGFALFLIALLVSIVLVILGICLGLVILFGVLASS